MPRRIPPNPDRNKQQELLSQIEKDLLGLERLHSLQFTLIRGLQKQLAEIRKMPADD